MKNEEKPAKETETAGALEQDSKEVFCEGRVISSVGSC